jgi:hypothetical protein
MSHYTELIADIGRWQRRVTYLRNEAEIETRLGFEDQAKICQQCAGVSADWLEHLMEEAARVRRLCK